MAQQAQIQKLEKLSKRTKSLAPQRVNKGALQRDRTAVQHLLTCPASPLADDVLALQRTTGNRATTRFIQTKLRVGPVGDRYEREADRVARQVMTLPEVSARSPVQRQEMEEEELQTKSIASSITPRVQRQEEEEEALQMKSQGAGGFTVAAGTESQLKSLRGSGKPLPKDLRSFMEPRFGADFGGVRVHSGGEAVQLNRELNAKAFTHGQDIYFGAGRYQPGTDAGKHLIAHELTHVIQQTGKVQRAPEAPAYVDEDFRAKLAARRRQVTGKNKDSESADKVDPSQYEYEVANSPLAAYEGEHLGEKKEAAALLAPVLHPNVPPPLPPRPGKPTPPPLPPRPWRAGRTPGEKPQGSFLTQGRSQPGWQAARPGQGAPRGNFLGTRQSAPPVKSNIVVAKAHTRLVTRTLEGPAAQQVKRVEKSKKHKLYNRFDLVEIAESDGAHVKNDAGEIIWYQIKGSSNEYIRASSVLSTAPAQTEQTGPDAGEGSSFWGGMDLAESATSTIDDRLVDRVRGLTAKDEKGTISSNESTELTRLGYGEGAVWSTAGILGMATSLKTVLGDESSRWDKVEAAFTFLSSTYAVAGGATQIAKGISEAKSGEDSLATKATGSTSAFSLSFQEFFSTLANLVKTTKSGVDLIRMVFESHKHGKNELLQVGSSLLLNALSTLKGAAKTARAINEALGGAVTGAFSQAASTIAVGIDIAISAIKTVIQSYYLAISANQWWKMSRREGELKSSITAQGYTKQQIKDVQGLHARRDAMLAELDRLIAGNEKKIKNKDLQTQKLISGAKTSQQFTKRQAKVDSLDAEIEELRQQNKGYKQKKADVEKETKTQEATVLSGPEDQNLATRESKSLDLAEIELVGELGYINKKRVIRQSVHISTNLVQIAGSIATLVSGPGAPAPLALKASAAGIDLSLPFFRAIKQFGRNIAAKNRAKGTSGISNKIFNADKSTAAKLQMRKRQAVRILTMVTQLNDLIPKTRNPVEYTRQVKALKAQAERVKGYIAATGCDPEKLYRANGKPGEQIKILVEELARREFV
jgi:hypothetical protein